MNKIPKAKGLEDELLFRGVDLNVAQPTERMAPDNIHKITTYGIFDGDNKIGDVQINSWIPLYRNSVEQIEHVSYEGVIPGYTNPLSRKTGMLATNSRTLDPSDPEFLVVEERKFSKPNNTPERPLYRHDGHPLRLADYEVDGKKRIVLSKEAEMELEKSLQKIGK